MKYIKYILLSLVISVAVLANSDTSNFTLTENPISENGIWINGKKTGIDWCDVQTLNNHATGTQFGNIGGVYNDSTAVLAGVWGSDQTAQATVVQGNTWQNSYEEVELRLRSSISAHNCTGYEFDFRNYYPGGYVAIVRWNGPLNSFTTIANANNNYHGIKQGDVIKATAVGGVLTAYVNGIVVAQTTDNVYSNGSPGVGFWLSNAGGNYTDFGLTNFSATDGGSPTPTPSPTPSPSPTPTPTPSPTPTPAPYSAWESSLLSYMQSIGISANNRNKVYNWMQSHPPTQ